MKKIILLIFLISLFSIKQANPSKGFSGEAVRYRIRGYEAQRRGDYDEAMKCYQKAIYLDPNYAQAHNDLGTIYEIRGWLKKAEGEYLKAININPNLKEAYSNLAFLYQSKGLTEKAVLYWLKRIEFGPPQDPWVRRAKKALSKYAPEVFRELTQKEEAENLMRLALEEKLKEEKIREEEKVKEEKIKKEKLKKEAEKLPLPFKKPEEQPQEISDIRLENYFRLEKDLANPELKPWLLNLNKRMFEILYGPPIKKKVLEMDGINIAKEKWIYKIPHEYKKFALKRSIILIFENDRLKSWQK